MSLDIILELPSDAMWLESLVAFIWKTLHMREVKCVFKENESVHSKPMKEKNFTT